MGKPAAPHQQRCRGCEALREELAQLQTQSQQQAKRDHHQCLLMFQQVQQLAKLNVSLVQRCNGATTSSSSNSGLAGGSVLENTLKTKLSAELTGGQSQPDSQRQPKHYSTVRYASQHHDDPKRQRLQALVVQQAHELETLRKKLESAISIPLGCQVDESKLIFSAKLGLLSSCPDHQSEDEDSEGESDSEPQSYKQQQKQKLHQVQLRKLPLTSLHAQIKSKDAEMLRLKQLASRFEAQIGKIVDKKREMALNYQQITQAQQAQLKKYFAQLQRLGREKRGFESKWQEIGAYVAVLERKLVDHADFDDDNTVGGRGGGGGGSTVGKQTPGRQGLGARQLPEKRNAADYILNI